MEYYNSAPPPPPAALPPLHLPPPSGGKGGGPVRRASQLYQSSRQVQTCQTLNNVPPNNMKLPCCFVFPRLRKKSSCSASDDAATNLLQNQILQKLAKFDLDISGMMRSPLTSASQSLGGVEQFVDVSGRTAAWYVPHLTAAACDELLNAARLGRFLVRSTKACRDNVASTQTSSSSFELFLRTESAVERYTIVAARSGRGGLCFEGRTKIFPSISALVVHHSIMREHLPALLALAKDQRTQDQTEHDHEVEEEEDIDFIDIDCDAEFSELVSRLQGHVSF